MFRGREITHPEIGRKILENVADAVGHVGRVEVQSKLDGRNMTMVLAPDKKAQAAWEAQKRKGPDGEGELDAEDAPDTEGAPDAEGAPATPAPAD